MYKSCSRCGAIHPFNYQCHKGKVYKHNNIDRLRSTRRWKNKSIEVRELSNYLCSVCLDKGIINYKDIEVHHIIKLQDDPDKLLDNEYLICLCSLHHKQADKGELNKDYLLKLISNRQDNA